MINKPTSSMIALIAAVLLASSVSHATLLIKDHTFHSILNKTAPVKQGTLGTQVDSSTTLLPVEAIFHMIEFRVLNNSNLFIKRPTSFLENVDPEVVGKPLNYPNPFRQETGTELGYMLSKNMTITVHLYNQFGHRIYKQTFSEGTPGGSYGYNRLLLDSNTFSTELSSGVYFFFIIYQGEVMAKGKMALIP